MAKRLLMLGVMVLAFACFAWAGTWTGTVSDDHCGLKHSTPSKAAAECVTKCVQNGGKYVLVSGGKVYKLDAQDKFKDYAGRSVKVTGTLDGDAITVESVTPAGAKKAKPKT